MSLHRLSERHNLFTLPPVSRFLSSFSFSQIGELGSATVTESGVQGIALLYNLRSRLFPIPGDCATGFLILLAKMLLCGCAHQKGHGEKVLNLDLTPLQEERIRKLQCRVAAVFDGTRSDHQEALKALWHAAFPDADLRGLVCEQWKEMGWQGSDPSTDFRGGGFISLENLIFFSKRYPKTFQQLLWKKGGRRATWEYPFAVAGVNITFMLIQMLDLRSDKPRTWTGSSFLKILAEEETAFDLLYCVAFKVMDTLWLAMHASYMEFNVVMKATRSQLEQELIMESVSRIEDMPSYTLLLYHGACY